MSDKESPLGANIKFETLPGERDQRLSVMAENHRIVRDEYKAARELFDVSKSRVQVTAHFKEVLSVPIAQQIVAMGAALKEIETVKKQYAMTLNDHDRRFFVTLKNLLIELLDTPLEELKTSSVLKATIQNLAEQAQEDRLSHIRRQGEKFAAQWKQKSRKDQKH
ncbi:MAG: hypothetical protein AAB440_03570 [Patescibacteria group bacterium]